MLVLSPEAEFPQISPVASSLGDVGSVVVAANVERLRGGSGESLLVEVGEEASMQLLRPKWILQSHRVDRQAYLRHKGGLFHFCPPFQAGKAFCPKALSCLTWGPPPQPLLFSTPFASLFNFFRAFLGFSGPFLMAFGAFWRDILGIFGIFGCFMSFFQVSRQI